MLIQYFVMENVLPDTGLLLYSILHAGSICPSPPPDDVIIQVNDVTFQGKTCFA